ncbi:sensor histidine kinase [Allomuricauda sp. NBRC 101325]|uniref:sensor histidine kinase n=1 Tax=Allomuricauda sp. NBRC 101325 TaxID=1113758 RepID=UPI0024A017F5|nr:sensor histidine kinase [Muricauda sp. NBRC 101325]GLU43975.1 histidine kinase [Muricauda sp. NBRC 101325]
MALKNRDLWINILIGLGLLSIPILTSPDFDSFTDMLKARGFRENFVGYLLLLVFYYANYYWLVPKLYSNKKRGLYFLSLLLCFLIVSYLPKVLFSGNNDFPNQMQRQPMPERSMERPDDMPPMPNGPKKEPLINIFALRDTFFIQFIIITILSMLLRLDNRLKKIQNEKLKAEVNYLKAQINPHFLFNTLNSIYALTLKKSYQAPWAVLKLSDMMRYVVTESDSEKVPLEYEIQYISDYIDLQKLRMGNNTDFTFEIMGEPNRKRIAPIILVNYVENAFKYGVNPDEASKISIVITLDPKGVELLVDNKITVHKNNIMEPTTEGNRNTKRRLDYFYPNKHNLEVTQNDDFYSVKLYLDLT